MINYNGVYGPTQEASGWQIGWTVNFLPRTPKGEIGDLFEKAFYSTVKTPRSQYVFDVNKNEMLPVSVESFDFGKCLRLQ